jgi:hypothetical protein
MKRLLSIVLAVLLAVGLGMMMFPTQSVEASVPGGAAFHISAEGEGGYLYEYPGSESGEGEFFINVAGQKGYNYKFNRGYQGYGTPIDKVQGHIRGSFGEHEIDVTLNNLPSYGTQVWLDQGRLQRVGFRFKGTYDGKDVTSPQSYIKVYYGENGELDYILADLCFTDGAAWIYFDITMYDASVDLHHNPNY